MQALGHTVTAVVTWFPLTALALLAWSRLSELQPGTDLNLRYACALLAACACVRLLGQGLRIRPLCAPARSIEVYAIATLAGLHQRPLSPWTRSLLTVCSPPLERVLQRLVGLGLQAVHPA
ncbi:MAG TPA: hypothetical protein VM369_07700 [Candidatus Binatia bacterium]|nr:hypothetical protein [Candidatus Binatia bacterium]